MSVHKTALVDPACELGKNVEIGPFAIVGPKAVIEDGCKIGPYAQVDWARIGAGCYVGSKSVVGGDPQIYDWPHVESWVTVGAGTFINEMTAIHRSMYEGKATSIGDGCYIMSQSHIGHDCNLGAGVTVTTLAGLSGHVEVGDHAVIGGAAGIHQFVRIGSFAMVGGMSRIVQDVAPFFTVAGSPARAEGLNTYALRKHNIKPTERRNLKSAYKSLVRSGLSLSGAISEISDNLPLEGVVKTLVDFLRSTDRGITL